MFDGIPNTPRVAQIRIMGDETAVKAVVDALVQAGVISAPSGAAKNRGDNNIRVYAIASV